MAEIINLNRARKDAARKAGKKLAEGNRLTFGRSKSEKQATDLERARAITHIDGHRLDKPDQD